jgi:hypothetical protein
MAEDETVLSKGRYGTDRAGFAAMLADAAKWPQRVWAVEACEGIGKHLVLRLLDAGEAVVDMPAKLSAQMRVCATGRGRKTDDTDALHRPGVGSAWPACVRSSMTRRLRCCGCWWTGAVGSAETTPRWCASYTRCSSS